ncbi:PP2C family serine/threonine-protein phosphatase [Herpetosiphon giganteus]|uniref:PP2C family serine/threonine-protein phosphatase n=1 Tax=Herpetosiphon giganteus TaxID=2029754 RepID=UPI00195B68FA|nr:PP2C family serine/threonine-protein phosphatase [Herpetosiphon giganteus]MBM7846532.1 serine/threonine protein phosphatase PrpC [Herpetosiphon giganteus]
MMNQPIIDEAFAWRAFGHSVRGASHVRQNLPNQDALCWTVGPQGGTPLVFALADGHGSPTHFRSDIGARAAVITAVRVLQDFVDWFGYQPRYAHIKQTAEIELPQNLVRAWRKSIDHHLLATPIMPDEIAAAQARVQHGIDMIQTNIARSPRTAYGTTLLAVAISRDFLIYLQIGDGDILVVSDDGSVTRPLPDDPQLLGNVTWSIDTNEPLRNFRVHFEVIQASPPTMILLATDGYGNSFVENDEDREFLKIGRDYLDQIRSVGAGVVETKLQEWLNTTSQQGSGDDITVGIIYRLPLSPMSFGSSSIKPGGAF